MLLYQPFYKNHGLRLQQQMARPPMSPLTSLALPVNSIYHYVSADADELGLPETDTVVCHSRHNVLIDHVTDFTGEKHGKPLQSHFQANQAISEYQSKHRMFKLMNKNKGMLKQAGNLLAVSYNMLSKRYHYMETYQTPYFHWANIHETLWRKVNELALDNTERQQYVVMEIPALLPSVQQLNLAKTTHDFYHKLHTDSLRMIRDLWEWCGVWRENSLMGVLTPEALQRVNFILVCGTQWTVVNLGILNAWRISDEKDTRGHGFQKIAPELFQKRVLHMFINMVKTMTAATDDKAIQELEERDNVVEVAGDDDHITPENTQGATPSSPGSGVKKTLVDIIRNQPPQADKQLKNDEEMMDELPEINDSDIEADLAQLDVMHQQADEAKELSSQYAAYTPPIDSMEAAIHRKAEALATKGLLTPAELRRMRVLAEKYKAIKNPYTGNGSVTELLSITPEDTAVPETNKIADEITGVFDESMLSSSLSQMNEKYIKTVLPKDLASVGLRLQKAGFAVTDYNIQKVDDITDSFDVHTFKVVPVVGKPSTIRIQVPRVNPDGSFLAGGIKYGQRSQRGD